MRSYCHSQTDNPISTLFFFYKKSQTLFFGGKFRRCLFLPSCLKQLRPRIYTAPGFSKAKSVHQRVAVIPFDVIIESRKLPKGVTPQMMRDQQKDNGYSIQSDVYSFFLREQSRGRYTIDFQDIDKTNSLISKAGLDYEALRTKSKDELATLLGVDAVISGKVTMSRPMSEGAAIAVGLLVGFWGNTNRVNATLTVHDSAEGTLLWKYDYAASGSLGSSSKSLSNALMRNASKRFPYRKG